MIHGRTYLRQWDCNAIARVHAETGFNPFESDDILHPVNLRASLYTALLSQSPDMTLEEAGRLIRPKTLPAIVAAINAVWKDEREA